MSTEKRSATERLIDPDSIRTSPSFFAQVVLVQAKPDEVSMQMCLARPMTITDDNGDAQTAEVLFTQATVYVTLAHAKRIHHVLGQQIAGIERKMLSRSKAPDAEPEV